MKEDKYNNVKGKGQHIMENNQELIYDVKRKMLAKYPRFGSEIAVANIEFKEDLPGHTAATDGKNVYVDPKYFESLSENQRLFTIAHEIMHIKFMHMFRLTDKNGKEKDLELWNIATDAIINANLERDGFEINERDVNIPGALNYSSEELYQKLLEEKEKKQNEEQNEGQNGQKQEQGDKQHQSQDSGQSKRQDGGSQRENNKQSKNQEKNDEQENKQENGEGESEKDKNKSQNENKFQGDDHSLWKKAFEEQQKSKEKGKEKGKNQKDTQRQQENQTKEERQTGNNGGEQSDENFDEREEFEENRKEKREKFKARREKVQKHIRGIERETIELGNIGESKEAIDWRVLLRREIEKTETIWSQRHSIAENNYAYRLEENDVEDEAQTEVMLDISGSVDLELIKAFLRQTKSLLGQSQLRVGCFATKASEFIEIKSTKDIDNFSLPKGCGMGTDLDLPVRSFSKKKETNKIIFTDGYAYEQDMPKKDLKKENVIWIVYGNKDFKPCCGKVINITEKQLEKLHQLRKSSSMDEMDR